MLHLELDKIHEYTRPVSQAGSLMAMDSFYKARQVLNEGYSRVTVSISGGKDAISKRRRTESCLKLTVRNIVWMIYWRYQNEAENLIHL